MGSRPWTARELLDLVLDARSFESWDEPIDISGQPEDYRRQLEAAAARAGTDESVLTGRGLVRGRPVAVIVNEFRFLAGSIGRAAAQRIASAVRRATAEGLPVLASTASGGTRMQEGTPAFVEMVEISRALMAHRAARLPYLVHLRHPTTGGVYASWGSLGHITVAEPGALVGFLGPKVYEAVQGEPFPAGIQTAENLVAKGVLDAVVAAEDLPVLVDRALGVLVDPATLPRLERREGEPLRQLTAWESIQLTRRPERPGVRELLRHGAGGTLRLRGTDEGERDATMLVALTRLDGQPCVLVGQDRARQSPSAPMGPGALRQARRAMRVAEELGVPFVTVIDTPGAELSPQAEEGAIAGEIARCIATLATMSVPTVSVVLGQGCGGGALALLPAREVIAAEHAWLSPLPPEGASVIMHGDVEHAAEMAELQQVRAADLHARGIVHRIVPEPANDTPRGLVLAVVAECAAALRRQTGQGDQGLRSHRPSAAPDRKVPEPVGAPC
jgi:acetyl-CoA carboxylase carboxyl transferase subunit beta